MKMIKMPLNIRDIALERLRNNELQNELPEIYMLKRIIENNSWHNNEPVFDHTINVISELGMIIRNGNNRIKKYLNQTIDENTQGGLLYFGALYHDIGKKNTMVKRPEYTFCVKHEEEGAVIAKQMLKKFFLSDLEQRIILDIIKHHSELHEIVYPKNQKLEEQYDKFISKHIDIFVELNLLAMADTSVSYLKHTDPEEYKFRVDFYKRVLDNY
jgi:putative nucleotidyltransferase with HDIG domain